MHIKITLSSTALIWSPWRKILFRFLFVYILLHLIGIVGWFGFLPGLSYLIDIYNGAINSMVEACNRNIFHVREHLVPLNGSGDTSFAWAQVGSYLLVAAVSCLIWSLFDRKRDHYLWLDYFLKTSIRYYIIFIALSYGISKIFLLQMPFPNLSQLATPLGDFLPMRFSWMFIGYSSKYQFFAGLMEVVVGLLLFNRKTITLGALVGAGVFSHVMVLNLFYDIPVKIFSTHLVFYFLYLLLSDGRLIAFFIFNKAVEANKDYDISLNTKALRIGRLLLKGFVAIVFFLIPFFESWSYYKSEQLKPNPQPFYGIYDVKKFVLAKDTIKVVPTDTIVWKDMIFDKDGAGSINTTDSLFRQRYRRGYFSYHSDTVARTINLFKRSVTGDSTFLLAMRYQINGDDVKIWTKIRNDSLYVELTRSKRHFQLAERQFHWLSEYNR